MQRQLVTLIGLVVSLVPACAPPPSFGFNAPVCAPSERCGVSLTCIDSFCVRACTSTGECSSAETCIRGMCRPNDGEPALLVCANDDACAFMGDARCVAGVCTFIDGQTSSCTSDAACGDPAYLCSEGLCTLRDLSAITTCFDDSHCPASHLCFITACGEEAIDCAGVCYPRDACAADETCGNGIDDDCSGTVDEGCSTGACVIDADCADGGPCTDGLCSVG